MAFAIFSCHYRNNSNDGYHLCTLTPYWQLHPLSLWLYHCCTNRRFSQADKESRAAWDYAR